MVNVVTTNPNTKVDSGTVTVVNQQGAVMSKTSYSGGHSTSSQHATPTPSSSHDSVGEATATSTAQAPLTQQQAEQSKTLPPSIVYVLNAEGQPTQVNYATQKIVMSPTGEYYTATGERVNIVDRTTSAGTPSRIQTSGAVASPVSNQFYSPTSAGIKALQQDVEVYNARQQAEAQLMQKVSMANLKEYQLPEQTSWAIQQASDYEAIGREYYEAHPFIAKAKYLGWDYGAIPSAIKGRVTGDYSDYYYGLGKVVAREHYAREEGFFGNIVPESRQFFGGTKITASQLGTATQPVYQAPRWDFTKGSFSEAKQREATPFVKPPEYTGQLAYATEFIPFKLALIYGTSKVLGYPAGYTEVLSKAGAGGKVVEAVAGVSKASAVPILSFIGAGVGKSIFDVATNPELRTTEKIGYVGGTAVELGTGFGGFMSGYQAGKIAGTKYVMETQQPVFTFTTSKQISASDYFPILKNNKLIGYVNKGEIFGVAESRGYGISIRTEFVVPSGKFTSVVTPSGKRAFVGVRGYGATRVATDTRVVQPTINYGEELILPAPKEIVPAYDYYGENIFKAGAIVEQTATAKFRGGIDYGAGLKLPAPYETYATTRVVQPTINYGQGLILPAPKEIVNIKNINVYEGSFTGKSLQGRKGTQEFDIDYSRGTLSNIQTKKGELYYNFGEAIEKNEGQVFEFGVSKFKKGKAYELVKQPVEVKQTKQGFQVVVKETQNIDYLTGDRTVYNLKGEKLYKGKFEEIPNILEQNKPELLVKEPIKNERVVYNLKGEIIYKGEAPTVKEGADFIQPIKPNELLVKEQLPSERIVYNLKGEPVYRGKMPKNVEGERYIENIAPPTKSVETQQPLEAGKPLRSQVSIKQKIIVPEPPVKVGSTQMYGGDVVVLSKTATEVETMPIKPMAIVGEILRGTQIKLLEAEYLKQLDVKTLSKTLTLGGKQIYGAKEDVLVQVKEGILGGKLKMDTATKIGVMEDTLGGKVATRVMTRTIGREDVKIDVQTITDTMTGTLTATKTLPKIKEPKPEPEIITPITPKISFEVTQKKRKQKGGAYVVMLKRKGKFFRASAPLEKPQALDVLAMKLSRTLGATAKIVPVRQAPVEAQTTGEFARLQGTFRTYKIQKGQRIPMENTYIQEAKYRLGTKEERTEIQSAKTMFGKLFGGFKK